MFGRACRSGVRARVVCRVPSVRVAITSQENAKIRVFPPLSPRPKKDRIAPKTAGVHSLLAATTNPMVAGWWVGVLIELVAVFCSAFGKVLLRLAAVRKQPFYYVVGVLIAAIISPVFDMVAYAFAPTTLLTACGGMVVVFNVVLSPMILAERLTVQRAASALLITIGTVGSSLFGSHDQTEQSQEDYMKLFVAPLAICYYVLLLAWYAVAILYIRRSQAKDIQCAWLAALGGSCSGVSTCNNSNPSSVCTSASMSP